MAGAVNRISGGSQRDAATSTMMLARRIRFDDARTLGAALALLLDVVLLSAAAILVLASVSAATGLVLTGALGLAIAPLLGWRYGPSSVSRSVTARQTEAVRTLLRLDIVLVALFVVAEVVGVPVQDGLGARLLLAAYAALMGGLVVGVLTVAVVIPLGYVWLNLMRRTWHQ